MVTQTSNGEISWTLWNIFVILGANERGRCIFSLIPSSICNSFWSQSSGPVPCPPPKKRKSNTQLQNPFSLVFGGIWTSNQFSLVPNMVNLKVQTIGMTPPQPPTLHIKTRVRIVKNGPRGAPLPPNGLKSFYWVFETVGHNPGHQPLKTKNDELFYFWGQE